MKIVTKKEEKFLGTNLFCAYPMGVYEIPSKKAITLILSIHTFYLTKNNFILDRYGFKQTLQAAFAREKYGQS